MQTLALGLRAIVVAALTLVLSVVALPAHAASTSVTDPVGDGFAGDRLDITAVSLDNGERRVRVTTDVVEVSKGAAAVYLQARGRRVVRVISEHDPRRERTRTYVLGRSGSEPRRCRGVRSTWDADAGRITVVLPSRCLARGRYGAVRTWVLTELGGGADADFAPGSPRDDDFSWTAWAPRG